MNSSALVRLRAHVQAGEDAEAAAAADALLATRAGRESGEVWLLRGVVAARRGEDRALADLGEAHRRGAAGAAVQLGRLHMRQGRLAEALAVLEPAADPLARLLAGDVLFQLGRARAAAERLAAELARLPAQRALAPFWARLGQAEAAGSRWEAARAAFEQALALDPSDAVARSGLARAHVRLNAPERCIALLGPSPAVHERWLDARAVPIVARDEAELARYHTRHAERLAALAGSSLTQAEAQRLLPNVEGAFYTHYACVDDRPVQQLHGALVHRVVHTAHPQLGEPLAPRSALPMGARGPSGSANQLARDRLRVGFVSSSFHEHTVSRLFKGWIEQLDRRAFEVGVYTLGARDAWCERIVACADRSAALTGDLLRDAACLRGEALDVVVYPELGMDVRLLRLAAVRCAPVQAVTWGHPVTTGLPTIDAFLTSDAMEPPDGEAHYAERLVRLPGLSLHLSAPAAGPRDRVAFGIPDDRFLILCTQTLYKLLPRNDRAFARLAREVPSALIVFLGAEGAAGADVFRARMERAFEAEGLRFDERAALFPSVRHERFLALNRAADLYVDGMAWSGGMTALEAVGSGLLPVALEGPRMRMRHTAAILRTLGLEEPIARDPDDLVARVAALAGARERHAALRERMIASAPGLWEDARPVRALERWLCEAVAAATR